MFLFTVKAINQRGELKVFKVLGENKNGVKKSLLEKGFTPVSIKKSFENISAYLKLRKIKGDDVVNFLSELYSLLKSGLPLLKSLSLIKGTTKNPFLVHIIEEMIYELEAGKSFSEVLENYTSVFGTLFPQIVKSGEESGNLPFVINDYNQFYKRMLSLKKRIVSSLIYPSAIFLFSFVVLMFIMNYVIPRFSGLYSEFNAELPFFSRFVISIGNFLSGKIFYLLMMIIFLFWGFKKLIKKNRKAKLFYHRILLKMPFGEVIRDFQITNFLKSFSLLLEGGIVVLKAFEFSSKTITNSYLYEKIHPVGTLLLEGESLSSSLEKTGFFSSATIEMVKVGETSGALSQMLKEASEYLDEKITLKVNSMVSFLEPAIILIMGIVIAVLLLAVYLPLFSVVRVIR